MDYDNTDKISKRIYKLIRKHKQIIYYKNHKAYEKNNIITNLLNGHNKGYNNYITWITEDMVLNVDYLDIMYKTISTNDYDLVYTDCNYMYSRNFFYNIDDHKILLTQNNIENFIDIENSKYIITQLN